MTSSCTLDANSHCFLLCRRCLSSCKWYGLRFLWAINLTVLFDNCVVVSKIWLFSCSIFKFASFNSSFSFLFSLATEAKITSTILVISVAIFAYCSSYRLANCVILSSILLMVFSRLLCISSVTILVILPLSIVFLFVAILFCLFGDFVRALSLMSSVFRGTSSISINTISSWLASWCLLSISLVWGIIFAVAFVDMVLSKTTSSSVLSASGVAINIWGIAVGTQFGWIRSSYLMMVILAWKI